MKKIFKSTAAYAAKNRGVLAASFNINGTNPIVAVSLIALVGIGVYTVKKFVDKATNNKEGGQV